MNFAHAAAGKNIRDAAVSKRKFWRIKMTKRKSQLPVKLGEKVKLLIESLAHGGEGVGRYQEFTIFVPDTAPGDQVEVKITELKKNYGRGKVMYLISPGAERIQPICSNFYKCGGCQWQHLPYEAQLREKTKIVKDNITRLAKLDSSLVRDTLGAKNPFYYRNKVQFPVGQAGGKMVVGFYAPGTHQIVPAEQCYIQHNLGDQVAFQAKEILEKYRIEVYNEETHRGFLRHLMVRVGAKTGELMLVLVTNGENFSNREKIVLELREKIGEQLVSICQNINSRRTNVILGPETKVLWGKETITDYIGNLAFHISPRSFYQVNPEQTEVLYNKALEYANLTGEETVIDAYCGIGTISLFLAQKAKKVYGIEVIEDAIEDARHNAALNNLTNTEFIVGESEKVMPQLAEEGIRPEVIVVDPPRKGCEKAVLEAMAQMGPERIVYVSCNPSSLARDLAYLEELGYKAVEIQPVDMFPQTAHVECVVRIEKV